ncbi:MAG: DNA polymerase III subunit gamma/tau, partial [Micropepsaceae bacterium]
VPAASGRAVPSAAPPSPPPLRMSSALREPAVAQHEPMARVDAAPLAKSKVEDFPGIVALAREAREARLVYALEHWVHLVKFERGRLEIRLDPAAPPALPGELSDKHAKWTGERWIVSVSSAAGDVTIAEAQSAKDQARRASAAEDPLLKAALAVFPGARIVAVRDRDAFEAEADNEGGEAS